MSQSPYRTFLGVRPFVWLGLCTLIGFVVTLRELPTDQQRGISERSSATNPLLIVRSNVQARFVPLNRGRATTQAIEFEGPGPIDLPPPDPSRIPLLVRLLSSHAPEERARAADELGRLSFAAADALPILTNMAKHDPDDSVRSSAGEAALNIRGYVPPPLDF